MKSSVASAASSRSLSGVDATGLPAIVISARTWPSPGVSISSARQTTGNSPKYSGNPRTRDARRPKRMPRPGAGGLELAACAAGFVNIAPPGLSRFPVSTLQTSTSHDARVPNSAVHVPIRAYTAAAGAAASSRAMLRMASASTPVAPATRSGAKSRASASIVSTPSTYGATAPRSTNPSANSTCTIANRNSASVPGTMATCSSASSAVFDRRGSTTTNFPPRARKARSRPGRSGAVHRLPFDANGFAPSMRR